ncbi:MULTISPECIES: leucyl/phenylalanyl-tRNA--protein transferase [Sphingobacterium]|uniref:leucyl/phenylalanyl-tRNA--protein transferase n=1 Tax=Sphingobacterium TaxID=28453 RepID=UPI0013DAAEF4|nr:MULTISPECIES: leucyl/phenylalanyl-tRNA--protein transferase [unclassified Sphingobacterium]
MGVFRKIVSSVIPGKYKNSTLRLFQKAFHGGLVKVSGGEEEALFWAYAQAKLTAYTMVQGFLQGTFPMPKVDNNKVFIWFDPDPRGIIPIADFKIRNDLLRCLKKDRLQDEDKRFEVRLNMNFEQTIRNCAKPRGEKTTTWITPEYIKVMLELHDMGIAHSVETYQNGKLVGGVLGVSLNGYFVTLSLFRTIDNASKVAFCYLLTKLKEDGFKLHISGAADSWFTQFGAVNVSKEDFKKELITAITSPVTFSTRIPELAL